jgi:GTP diphosphokinase / guanosine-3',5'-bis(diphosphate) 3'-diphosphatase
VSNPPIGLEDLVAKAKSYNPEADEALIKRAHDFAQSAHAGQRRRSGEPYVVHPVGVASIIEDLRLDVASICAGLLHDSVEDTTTSVEQLTTEFSEEIAFLVDGVTKLGKISLNTREERQAENFRKMLVAMARDIRVILIKLADRTDNMRTLEFMPPDRQEAIARETMEIYAPLANRLGIYWIKAELEDLAFRYLYPEENKKLIKELAVHERERRKYIEEVERILRKVMHENAIVCDVGGRFKNLWGIYSKMRRTARDLEQIHDVVAFRITTENIRDCYAALGVVHENFTPIPGRFKDYVAMPKPNQYQSLHTSVIGPRGERMEVQIRTHEMHRIAEEGIAAHWEYKEGKSGLSDADRKKFSWLRQLVDFQKDLKDPAEFIDAVKIDLFADEVYIFTPQGDVKAFPAGSTPVDFAYSIHSDVGDHCAGCRVNGLIVPLRYKLRNGDTVEIITSPSQRPNKDWLKFVATARARSKIRHHIRGEQRDRGRTLGQELLEREFRKYGYSMSKLQKKGDLQQAASRLRVGSEDDLIMYVGFGKLTAAQVVRTVVPEEELPAEPPPPEEPGKLAKLLNKVRRRSPTGIRVQDVDDVLIRFAHCCNPVPGESIIGFITRGRGVTIHKVDCAKALDLDPERRIEVSWDDTAKVEHPVAIEVSCTDKPGLLAEMSKVFSEQGVNISIANCRATGNARAVNTFHFNVFHLTHLKQVMRALLKIKGVFSVERVGG